MTMAVINLFSFGAVSESFGHWCRRYPAKDLARMFGCADQTAKQWRLGKLPEPRNMVAMVERWGAPFLEAVFAPALDRLSDESLIADLEAVEGRVRVLRERIKHEQGVGAAARISAAEGVWWSDRGGGGGAVAGRDCPSDGRTVPAARRSGGLGRIVPALAGLMMLTAAAAPVLDDAALALAQMFGSSVGVGVDDGGALRPRPGGRTRVVRVARATGKSGGAA